MTGSNLALGVGQGRCSPPCNAAHSLLQDFAGGGRFLGRPQPVALLATVLYKPLYPKAHSRDLSPEPGEPQFISAQEGLHAHLAHSCYHS